MGEKILDFIIEKFMSLPILLTKKSKLKSIRIIGCLIYLLWIMPAVIISLPFMFVGLIILFVELGCSD